MKKNRIGKSDIYVSELSLGCMSLGTDVSKAHEIINTALDAGINHIDTADLYDFGKNEEIIGKAIKRKRDKVILTTKVGNHFNPDTKEYFWDPTPKHIEEGIKNSLQRLQTDYIDIYLLHGGTLEDPIDETIATFEKLKKAGLIRAYGISSIRPNVIKEFVKRSNIDAVMMQYSLLDRRPEEDILNLLHTNNISVLARGPLAKGLLGNQMKKQIETKGKNGFLDYTYEELKHINENIEEYLTSEFYINELALKYVLKHKAVATTVFGASSLSQIRDNTSFDYSKTIPTNVYQSLQHYTKPIKYAEHR